jgi:DNA-binding beta-propeller fold protein YncE
MAKTLIAIFMNINRILKTCCVGMAFGALALLLLPSCVKDKPIDNPDPILPAAGRRIFIANEGNYNSGEASLSFINTSNDSIYNNVVSVINGNSLGDVFQSIFQDGERLYLVMNNSDKIIVLHHKTLEYIGIIPIAKPRNILKIAEDKFYVSTLYHNSVAIVNPQSLSVTGYIALPYNNTEGLVMHQNNVYVSCWDTACNSIYAIDAINDIVMDTIPIQARAPHAVLIDKNEDLWVFSGNVEQGVNATITKVSLANGNLQSINFPSMAEVIKPIWNATKDTMNYIAVKYSGVNTTYNGIYQISITSVTPPVTPFIPAAANQYYWSLGIDPITHHVFVGDPKGFIQRGAVMEYNPQGMLVKTYTTDIGPSFFWFEQ